jgi:hypothetical protein
MNQEPASPRHPLRRWGFLVLAVFFFGAAAAAFAFFLSRRDPSWWRDVKPTDPATINDAEQVENGFVAQASLARPADPVFHDYHSQEWSVSIADEDADAWLSTRLKQWLDHRSINRPRELGDVQVSFEEDTIRIGVRVSYQGRDQVVVAEVTPSIHADGSLWLPAGAMALGEMPFPISLVMARLRAIPQAHDLADVLEGKRAALQDPVLKLEDGRTVRLLGISIVHGRLEVRCRTEKKS